MVISHIPDQPTSRADTAVRIRLGQLNKKWSDILGSDKCPAVLGLLGLSEAECDEVSGLVRTATEDSRPYYKFSLLKKLLIQHPAIIAIWLARKAGEAYELGAFWDRFKAKIGVEIQPYDRPLFAQLFRDMCLRVMFEYAKPPEPGALKHVETFLFQAGLPLCHCERFAALIHQVERQYGLPDHASPDAGQELCDRVLESSSVNSAPLLKRALRGAAGSMICHTALRVVIEADYEGINPQLGRALCEAFAHLSRSQLRRSARQPYLRLSSDLCSLEIVGPQQDDQIKGPSGLEWLVDGKAYPTPSFDEFVVPVNEQSRVSLELRGLRGGLTATRTFTIRLADRHQPFMLFDAETRKLLPDKAGPSIWIPSGDYLLLHQQQSTLKPDSDHYDWVDGERTLSQLHIRPETDFQLVDKETWSFRASQDPFLEFEGEHLVTDEDELIHFGWKNLPKIWFPLDEDSRPEDSWSVVVNLNGKDETFKLSSEVISGRMGCCQPDGTALIGQLAPGLHRLTISVFRHQRRKLYQSVWLWTGLREYRLGNAFEFSEFPTNLCEAECRGFQIFSASLRHSQDNYRQHRLSFDVGNQVKQFCWTQRGIFLESLEKRAGLSPSPVSHELGQSFSASTDSDRWLRIWCVPATKAELLVNGESHQRMHTWGRSYFDVSLANLAAIYPRGGEISLHRDAQDAGTIATFAQPLVANKVCPSSSPGFHSLGFEFCETVSHVRLRITELAANHECFGPENELLFGQCVFHSGDLPDVACVRVQPSTSSTIESGCTVQLTVPNSGWPTGFWMLELDVRRDELSDWQIVKDRYGQRAPLLMVAPSNQHHDDWRIELFSSAYKGKDWAAALDSHLFDFLAQLLQLMKQPFAPEVRSEFKWLESLIHKVGVRVGRQLRSVDDRDINHLLDLTSLQTDVLDRGSGTTPNHSLFVAVPGLMALSAEHYSEISSAHPLARALQWCGRLAMHEFVFDAFRSLIEEVVSNSDVPVPDTYRVLQLFDNFAYVIQSNGDGVDPTEFFHFKYSEYIDRLIGEIQRIQLQAEWTERSALGRTHAEWALWRLECRSHEPARDWGAINALLKTGSSFQQWLRQRLGEHSDLVPADVWHRPWLQVNISDHDFFGNCARFASLFALSLRASAAGWLIFEDVTKWLVTHGDRNERTIAAIVGLAPELLGFYLMFWELMVRTYPHERSSA
jgi:hypothetical protein